MKTNTKSWIFWAAIALLFLPGLVNAYFLMPFPGSQDTETIKLSYYLEKIILPLRIIGLLGIIGYLVVYYRKNKLPGRIIKALVLVIGLGSFYFTDIAYKAEAMFEEPGSVKFANAIYNKVPESFIVLGVVNNGVAKAYPLIYLGYHHKIQDNVGNLPVLITYCTMCRSGRVYSPMINGVRQNFRLVGARHYNAVIEDQGSKTWWYQATGEAAVGPLQGNKLKELPYEQLTLSEWLNKHPASLVLQPDQKFKADYQDLKDYDRVQYVDMDSNIKNKDQLMRKSWVLGVIINKQPKAYTWRKLEKSRVINDKVGNTPVLVGLEKDSLSFQALNRQLDGRILNFKVDTAGHLTDNETASVWDWDGLCISGVQKGKQLEKIQAYQEYWHSWKHFHPTTLFWDGK